MFRSSFRVYLNRLGFIRLFCVRGCRFLRLGLWLVHRLFFVTLTQQASALMLLFATQLASLLKPISAPPSVFFLQLLVLIELFFFIQLF